MDFMPFLFALLIIAFGTSYCRRFFRISSRQWAERRPLNRTPVEIMYAAPASNSFESTVVEICRQDGNENVPPDVEYEEVDEPDVE